VHFATASRALDPAKSHLVKPATRGPAEAAAANMGYATNLAARLLRTGQSNIVGFAVADIANPFLAPILRGTEAALMPENYWVIVAETQDRPGSLQAVVNRLLTRNVDALVISAARDSDLEYIRTIAQRVPVVLAIRDLGTEDFFSVTHDDRLGGFLAASHLADLGHAKFGELRGPTDTSSFRQRSVGFRDVLQQRELRDLTRNLESNPPTIEGGYRAAYNLLNSDEIPTAVFAHNDMMAVGALQAFAEAGLSCPSDISIVGYNDAPLTAHLSPALTTIRLTGWGVGTLAAERLLALIDNPNASPVIDKLPPELIVRKSTRKLR
jgi:LacI family transcriptional regulator